ncbi:hypothetical protein WR164_01900 [Philodulcilactobacillus myokoensis]|uniref:Uncharacterized protein n=1 Tax=Philodulcilactobacillus myokoensis TaxID=2929573 RepID=A0A9W6AZS1_9LACO|nr:hypothetical protein [Philodulcilactobacillus myokoensis]GLB46211.1 hypothetical protein WR164_01900 [Philodulcilactobacillus myokoensis]
MKKISVKSSLFITPLAILLLGGSLNTYSAKADDVSWSQQVQNNQQDQQNKDFIAKYSDKDLENLASDSEKQLYDYLNLAIDYFNNTFQPKVQNRIKRNNDKLSYFKNFNVNETNKNNLLELLNRTKESKLEISYTYSYDQAVSYINSYISGDNDGKNLKSSIQEIQNDEAEIFGKVDFYDFTSMDTNTYKNYSIKALNESKNYNEKSNQLTNNDKISNNVINDINNAYSDIDFIENSDITKMIEYGLDGPSNKIEIEELNQSQIKINNYDKELNNVSNTLKNITSKSQSQNNLDKSSSNNYVYIPINNNNTAQINDINNKIQNLQTSLDNQKKISDSEIQNLQNQISKLKKELTSKADKSKKHTKKINWKLLDSKRKAFNKINRQLKRKHISKRRHHKLINQRKRLIKEIKKLK